MKVRAAANLLEKIGIMKLNDFL